MELFAIFVFVFIGWVLMYSVIYLGVKEGIAKAGQVERERIAKLPAAP